MELVVSSAGAARLGAARRWLSALPRDQEALVIAAHGHAATELVRTDVAGAGSRFGIQRFTLGRFAARLALPELAKRGATSATSLSLAAVVTRAIHHLLESGHAGRFAAIARRPGFPHAVVRTWEELRGAGLSAASLRAEGAASAASDLAAIAERTERELAEMGLADRAEILRIARDVIERGEAFPGAPVLLLDLALEQQTEVNLVSALMSRAPRGMATAPAGDTRAVLQLQTLLGVPPIPVEDSVSTSSLVMLQQHLFEESSPSSRDLDASVALTSWPGEARECVEIARRIQEEAAEGMRFDRMAVLLRSPGSYRTQVEEALRRAAVPAHFARGTRRPDPAGRALLALLACRAQDLSARRFAEYLSLSQVPDPSPESEDPWRPPEHDLAPLGATTQGDLFDGDAAPAGAAPQTMTEPDPARAPWRWERLLVDAAVIGGRDRWKRRLDGLVREIALRRGSIAEEDARAAGLARVGEDLEQLRAFALPIIDLLDELPREATWSAWLECLRRLGAAAIRDPDGVLAVLTELEPLGPVGPVDLDMVRHVLAPRLRDLTVASERHTAGAVFVAPIEMARGLTFDIVFVPGMAERLFPPRIVEDPLLPDRVRATLETTSLATQDARVARERLGLRLAVGAATRRVVLSWPRIDLEKARARVPSFYGLEAYRAATGRLPGFDELRSYAEEGGEARLGWPAPDRPERAIDDSEYDLAVLAALEAEGDTERSKGAARYLLNANPHLSRALRARGRRWLRRWTIADGLVDPDPDGLAALARHRMGARPYSPTALEHFAACPYRFFLQAVHRLQPREEAEALETIDPLTRGALFHEIQFEVSTLLRDRGHLPLDPDHLETAITILNETVDRVAAAHEERLAPAIPRVWMDGMNSIRADLREWLRRSAEGARGWVPERFELSFGLADRDRPNADASSAKDPVQVLGHVLLRGSIDLVERRADGARRVTDHKTGKARVPAGAVVWGGQTLQPVLYGLVAEEVLKGPVESGRLYYCTADGDFTERVIPLDLRNRELAGRAIDLIGRALEQGFLPAAPAKDACRWCDYRAVCGSREEARTARKPKERLAELIELRGLP
jgi:CRISPR/Cas system-associated exonuclease Cas4 (RecB family)